MSDEFSLNGKTLCKNGIWGNEVWLITPDGNQTTLASGFIFKTEEEAMIDMKKLMDSILEKFGIDGVEVLNHHECLLQ